MVPKICEQLIAQLLARSNASKELRGQDMCEAAKLCLSILLACCDSSFSIMELERELDVAGPL